jgi:hypothetical protein
LLEAIVGTIPSGRINYKHPSFFFFTVSVLKMAAKASIVLLVVDEDGA